MGKKNQGPTAAPAEAAGLDVAFNFAAGELRTEEITLPGHKPFSITFRVPGAGASADLALAASGGSNDDELASRGEAMVRYCAQHLAGWTLAKPSSWDGSWPNLKAVGAIRDPLVLFSIFSKIREAGADAKN